MTAEPAQPVTVDRGWRLSAWLTGMAAANALYLIGLGVAGTSDVHVLLVSAVFAATVGLLSATLLPGSSPPAERRGWTSSMLSWGLLFGLTLGLGLPLLRESLPFWTAAAVVVPLPLAIGVRAETRAVERR